MTNVSIRGKDRYCGGLEPVFNMEEAECTFKAPYQNRPTRCEALQRVVGISKRCWRCGALLCVGNSYPDSLAGVVRTAIVM